MQHAQQQGVALVEGVVTGLEISQDQKVTGGLHDLTLGDG